MKYERSKWRDPLDEYLRLEPLGPTEEQIAVSHVVPLFTQGLSYIPPIDPEVGLTKEDLEDRISKREAARLEVAEEKTAMLAFERYRQDPRRKGRG